MLSKMEVINIFKGKIQENLTNKVKNQ